MTYKGFQEYVRADCCYTAIYTDSEGREILVIPMLDAFAMVNDAPKREWVGLTQTQVKLLREGVHEESIKTGDSIDWVFYTHINEALKEKNK